MERSEKGRASKNIGLCWSEQSKENHIRSELVDQREGVILDWIGYIIISNRSERMISRRVEIFHCGNAQKADKRWGGKNRQYFE